MTFYESERITRKQENYEKSRAYEIIESLKKKNLTFDQMLVTLGAMFDDKTNTETQRAVLIRAHDIITTTEQGRIDAANLTSSSSSLIIN